MHIQSNGKECQQKIITHYSHPDFSEINIKMFPVVVRGNSNTRVNLIFNYNKGSTHILNMHLQLNISVGNIFHHGGKYLPFRTMAPGANK